MKPWLEARRLVLETVAGATPRAEVVPLAAAAGRVLAEAACIDRDLPPFDRSTRDGFAVRAADLASVPTTLRVLGEVRAGESFAGAIPAGACVEIFTGAPVPAGADAVVMVEYARREGDTVELTRSIAGGDNIVPRGREGRAGEVALPAGRRLGVAELALCATLGVAAPRVFARPRVAILSTGDEIVDVTAVPGPNQIRNSNGTSLAAQAARAGAEVVLVDRVGDSREALRQAVLAARAVAEVVLLSGGVSMGKYDLVEDVLAGLGASIVFDGAAIRPGKPVVFGRLPGPGDGGLFFGLPGNPLSTLVTFELFARPALAVLGGEAVPPVRFLQARLAEDLPGKPLPLTVFLPAVLEGDEGGAACVRPLPSQGSGDLVSLARADVFVVLPAHAGAIPAGTEVSVFAR